MKNDFYVAKTTNQKYCIISKLTGQRVLSDSFDLILPIIGNQYAIVGNKSVRRFKGNGERVKEYSFHYHAFDLCSGNEILPMKDDEYSLLYFSLEDQTLYYSLDSDDERIIREMSLSGNPKCYMGPVKYTSFRYNYRIIDDPANMSSPDYVSPEMDIDKTGVFPHTDSKWDFMYTFLVEDQNSNLIHKYSFNYGNVHIPNAHITIINNQFCIVSHYKIKKRVTCHGYEYDEEVFHNNFAIFNEYEKCILISRGGFAYHIESDDRLMLYSDRVLYFRNYMLLSSSGILYRFPKDVFVNCGEKYALKSDHLHRIESFKCFGFTDLDAGLVIPCIFPKPKYEFDYFGLEGAEVNHSSTLYDAFEGDASNYWNVD